MDSHTRYIVTRVHTGITSFIDVVSVAYDQLLNSVRHRASLSTSLLSTFASTAFGALSSTDRGCPIARGGRGIIRMTHQSPTFGAIPLFWKRRLDPNTREMELLGERRSVPSKVRWQVVRTRGCPTHPLIVAVVVVTCNHLEVDEHEVSHDP